MRLAPTTREVIASLSVASRSADASQAEPSMRKRPSLVMYMTGPRPPYKTKASCDDVMSSFQPRCARRSRSKLNVDDDKVTRIFSDS